MSVDGVALADEGVGDAIAMNPEQAASLLAQTPIFRDIPRDILEDLARASVERTYRKGQPVFHEEDPGDALFLVVEGLVKVFVTSEEGDEMVLVVVRPPEVFGELALIDGGRRSASAETLEATTLLALDRRTFLELLKRDARLSEALLRSLGGLIRRLTGQASDFVFLDLAGRVAKLLLALADEGSGAGETPGAFDLHMSQANFAGMVGGSRQSVNQILHDFERRGYLEIHGREIVLKKIDLLQRRAGL